MQERWRSVNWRLEVTRLSGALVWGRQPLSCAEVGAPKPSLKTSCDNKQKKTPPSGKAVSNNSQDRLFF